MHEATDAVRELFGHGQATVDRLDLHMAARCTEYRNLAQPDRLVKCLQHLGLRRPMSCDQQRAFPQDMTDAEAIQVFAGCCDQCTKH